MSSSGPQHFSQPVGHWLRVPLGQWCWVRVWVLHLRVVRGEAVGAAGHGRRTCSRSSGQGREGGLGERGLGWVLEYRDDG